MTPVFLGRPGPPGARGPSEVGLWRPLHRASAHFVNGSGPAGTYYPLSVGFVPSGTGNGTEGPSGVFRLSQSELVHPLLAVELRIVQTLCTNSVAPGSDFRAGLYPVSASGGGAGLNALTLGTVVPDSVAPNTVPAANVVEADTSGSFAVPNTGVYCFGVVTTATPAAGSFTVISIALEMRLI